MNCQVMNMRSLVLIAELNLFTHGTSR